MDQVVVHPQLFMKLKPVDHRVLIQLHFPEESGVVLPDNVSKMSPVMEKKRTRIECLEVGENVTVCKKADFLLLHGDAERNLVPIDKDPPTALIHDSIILGIVLDDAQYVR